MRSYQQFLAELKRRKVFKVAGVYGAVAFGLIQVAEPLAMALGLPDAFLTYVVAILFLGFPLAIGLAWALEVTPEGVQKTEAAAPGEIEAIVAQPMSQRWPAGLMALAGVGALVAGGWWVGRQTAPEAVDTAAAAQPASNVRLAFTDPGDNLRPSLAVLPFLDMSPGSDQEYFSDGITEEILNTLVRIRELKVAARTSAFAFKGQDLDMRVIGDSLGVAYLIEGSVRKAGNQLRITAQLIDASDGSHLWSDTYDEELTAANVFQFQTDIAEAIAEQLRIPLGLDDPSGLVTPTADLEAYDLYLAGLAQMRTRGAAVAEAARLFEAAIAHDSTWAPAWAKLAESREISTFYREGWDNPPTTDEEWIEMLPTVIPTLLDGAEQAARRALTLDSDNASAYVALGSVLRDRHGWPESEAAYQRALALDPDNAEAHHQYGELFEATGRQAEALRSYERAVALDPAPIRRGLVGYSLYMNGRPEEAILILRQALSDSGNLPLIGSWLVKVLESVGELERSARLRIGGGFDPGHVRNLNRAFETRDASLLSAETQTSLTPEQWMLLGEPDRAKKALSAALALFSVWRNSYTFDPLLDPIQDSPEMQDYLRRLNLEGVQVQRAPKPDAEAAP